MRKPALGLLIITMTVAASLVAETVNAGKVDIPLKNGIYVAEGAKCPKPGTRPIDLPVDSINYTGDGLGFNDGNNHGHLFDNVHNKGNIYYINGKTITGVGGHNMGTFHLTIEIKTDSSFSITKAEGVTFFADKPPKKETVYRYCGNPYKY